MKAVVRDVMPACPVRVSQTASVKEIAAKLREFRVSAFPVLDADGRAAGVVQGVVAVRDRLVYPVPPVPSRPGLYF